MVTELNETPRGDAACADTFSVTGIVTSVAGASDRVIEPDLEVPAERPVHIGVTVNDAGVTPVESEPNESQVDKLEFALVLKVTGAVSGLEDVTFTFCEGAEMTVLPFTMQVSATEDGTVRPDALLSRVVVTGTLKSVCTVLPVACAEKTNEPLARAVNPLQPGPGLARVKL
jgi:hypothetical protein